eukprot:c20920_g1_i1.p1 GENE.c20920_g1_i1~~c20920_g1_i1.p1  ORF type:complete len:201 (-),score=45.62 c20920_g1_i1:25-627(-)
MLGDSEDNATHSVVGALCVALMNERHAPELLPFNAELVADVKAQIQEQEEIVDSIEDVFTRNLFRMDLERILFCLRSYLRTRLLKVQSHSTHYTLGESAQVNPNLSPEESRFAKELVAARAGHLASSFLDSLPPQHRTIDKPDMVSEPNVDKFVFALAVQDVGTLRIDNGDSFSIDRDDIYLTRYAPMQNLIQTGKIRLI